MINNTLAHLDMRSDMRSKILNYPFYENWKVYGKWCSTLLKKCGGLAEQTEADNLMTGVTQVSLRCHSGVTPALSQWRPLQQSELSFALLCPLLSRLIHIS